MDMNTLALLMLGIQVVAAISEPELWKVWFWLDGLVIVWIALCNSSTAAHGQ